MDIIGSKISFMLSDETSVTGVVDDIVMVGDSEFLLIDGKLFNIGFIMEVYIHDFAKVLPFKLKSITT